MINRAFNRLRRLKQQATHYAKQRKEIGELRQQLKTISYPEEVESVLAHALKYVEGLRIKEGIYGQYQYSESSKRPVLYASVFAVLLRHSLKDLDINDNKKMEWVSYINSFQCDDGIYRDPLLENDIAEKEDWWGWRHLTVLVLMALRALDALPKYPLSFLEAIDTVDNLYEWLAAQNWDESIDFTSNRIQNYGVFLQFADEFMGEQYEEIIYALLEYLSEKCDPETGLWLPGYDDAAVNFSHGNQAAYHFWLLYWYQGKNIPYSDKAITSMLSLQNRFGGFNLQRTYSSACEDIDVVQPLVMMSTVSVDQDILIGTAIQRVTPWIIYNFNEDGGAVFRRAESFKYGHENMFSEKNESSIFATWFRCLSLVYCSYYVSNHSQQHKHDKFQFLNCPGYQFAPTYDGGASVNRSC